MGLDRDFVALPASDYVSTFRGHGVEPDVVALADHVFSSADLHQRVQSANASSPGALTGIVVAPEPSRRTTKSRLAVKRT